MQADGAKSPESNDSRADQRDTQQKPMDRLLTLLGPCHLEGTGQGMRETFDVSGKRATDGRARRYPRNGLRHK